MTHDRLPEIPMPWELAGTDPGTPVLLALSGGADSRYLLEKLANGAKRDGFLLTLAHVHHGIRGETADRDRDFCVGLAREYGLRLEILTADVPALAAEHGTGIEEEARAVRYAFFEKLMRENAIPLLATAHQADDLLETLLFRIARGTDARGLDPIPPVRPFANGWLVRPLLSLSAAEIRERCRAEGLAYVTDETNDDATYARNRIRQEIIPVLESLFPEPQKRALRLAEAIRRDEAFLSGEAEKLRARFADGEIDCALLMSAPEAIRTRVLIAWLEENGIGASYPLLKRLEDLASGANGRRIPAGGEREIVRRRGNLVLKKTPPKSDPEPYRLPFAEGRTDLPGGSAILVEKENDGIKIHILSTDRRMNFQVESDIIKNTGLFWRPKQEGDRVRIGKLHRLLRRIWREAGVPEEERRTLPVLCNADGIVWAPFLKESWNREDPKDV